jgi:hypothetical protein
VSAGDPFDLGDNAPANIGLEGFGGEIPESSEQADKAETSDD